MLDYKLWQQRKMYALYLQWGFMCSKAIIFYTRPAEIQLILLKNHYELYDMHYSLPLSLSVYIYIYLRNGFLTLKHVTVKNVTCYRKEFKVMSMNGRYKKRSLPPSEADQANTIAW